MSISNSYRSGRMYLRTAVAAALATAAVSSFHALADEQEGKKEQKTESITVVIDDEGEEAEATIEVQGSAPKFWLGVMLKDIEGDLASYLGNIEGVLVDSVFPDSPAAEAGLEKGDIVIKLNDQKLTDAATVMSTMSELSSGEEAPVVTMLVLRKGNEVTVEVQAAERPQDMQPKWEQVEGEQLEGGEQGKTFSFNWTGENASDEIRAMIDEMNDGLISEKMKILKLGDPAMIFIPDGEGSNFDNMQIVISKNVDGEELKVSVSRKDGKPAEITVESDGETTTYSEEDMEAMPAEVREIVEQALSKSGKKSVRIGSGAIELSVDSEKAKVMAEKIKAAAEAKAKDLQARAGKMAEEARVYAERAAAEAHEATARATRDSAETSELRKLIDELRAEVKSLRKQLEEKDGE